MTQRIWLAALALAAVQVAARADDAYTLKVKFPDVGDTVLVDRTQTSVSRTTVVDAKGKQASDDASTTTETYVFKETILARGADKALAKVRREYEKAQLKEDDKTTELPYQGKTVLIEKKKDGKFHFEFEGGNELTGKDAELLDDEFNPNADDNRDFERYLLPSGPVTVGEPWKLDMPPLVKTLGRVGAFEGEASAAKGAGRLVKAYADGDRQMGRLAIEFEIPIKALIDGKDKTPALEGSRTTSAWDIDICIDGKAVQLTDKGTYKTVSSAMTTLPDGSTGKATYTYRGEIRETDKELPRK